MPPGDSVIAGQDCNLNTQKYICDVYNRILVILFVVDECKIMQDRFISNNVDKPV